MPDIVHVDVEGLYQLLSKLDVKKYASAVKVTMQACADLLTHSLATYPPETEANQPRAPNTVFSISTRRPVNSWYERGLGTRTCTGRVYKTSQDLGHSWTRRTTGLMVEIGSRVTYGPYVQGSKQAGFHGARGWRTIWQVVEQQQSAVAQMIRVVVDRLLGTSIATK